MGCHWRKSTGSLKNSTPGYRQFWMRIRYRNQVVPGRCSKVLYLDSMTVCFCTLAIHAPYRRRARHLCGTATTVPWIVLTDEPEDFADLPVRAIRHTPTGPMAVDYL